MINRVEVGGNDGDLRRGQGAGIKEGEEVVRPKEGGRQSELRILRTEIVVPSAGNRRIWHLGKLFS